MSSQVLRSTTAAVIAGLALLAGCQTATSPEVLAAQAARQAYSTEASGFYEAQFAVLLPQCLSVVRGGAVDEAALAAGGYPVQRGLVKAYFRPEPRYNLAVVLRPDPGNRCVIFVNGDSREGQAFAAATASRMQALGYQEVAGQANARGQLFAKGAERVRMRAESMRSNYGSSIQLTLIQG